MADWNAHQHFFYDLWYNLTSRKQINLRKCAIIKGTERLFGGKSHRIYVGKHTGIRKQALQRRVDKFILEVPFAIILPMGPKDLLEYPDSVLEERKLKGHCTKLYLV